MTFTDINNPGNTGNQLSLSPDSTANGFAIQIKNNNNGNFIYFGPDSANPGNTNQFLVINNATGTLSIPFSANIIKTGAVTAGDYTARATFTFSYQ